MDRNDHLAEFTHPASLPEKAQQTLLQDAATRDRTTARRLCLLRILWFERYLTRTGLVARVEGILGKGCFGGAAWEDTFYRDIRVVKQALRAAGYELTYSRSRSRLGYYLRGQPGLHPELARVLDGSIAEVDGAQIAIVRRLKATDRFRQGFSISDTASQAVAFRLRQREPGLTPAEARRLSRAYGRK